MALTDQNKNWISRAMAHSSTLLDMRAEFEEELGAWNSNDMFNTLTDQDIQAVPTFAHLSKSKVVGFVNAMKAFLIALGDSTDENNNIVGDPIHIDVGSQAENLIKMRG